MGILWRATVVLLLLSACRQASITQQQRATAAGPRIDATVVTIRTTVQPAERSTTHSVIIAGSKARSTDEADRWRLYDLEAKTVTFVNDLDRTWRRETIESVIAQRRAALRRPADRELPAAEFQSTGAEREILALPATQSLIRLGGYQRELWFARHPQIPEELFAAIHATAEPATRMGAIVAKADEALIEVRGFPMVDRAELPYGNSNLVVERSVVAVETKDVPASMLQVPQDYREITAPAERRQPASSRPPDRKAPAAGSPPSATSQTAP